MNTTLSRARLKSRYHVQGPLVLDTALHLGGGRIPAKGTDSPIIRDGFGRPYIPGSSIKGAVRASVERIAPNLNCSACGLYDREADCLSALPETDRRRASMRELQAAIGRDIDETLKRHLLNLLDGDEGNLTALPHSGEISEENLLFLLERNLCDVCKAFGSPFISSTIFFHDVPVDETLWLGITQVRDGVGIDRDSGRAVDGLKYDYEVVPAETCFSFSLTIESVAPLDLGLAALALHELQSGNIPLGGIRSRGLGRCHLDKENTWVEILDFTDLQALQAYLTENKTGRQSLDDFIKTHISNLWATKEGNHV